MDTGLPFNLDPAYLIASLLWSAVGTGFWIYGKKQRNGPALFGGVGMIGVTFLIQSVIWMSVACIAIIAAVYFYAQRDS